MAHRDTKNQYSLIALSCMAKKSQYFPAVIISGIRFWEAGKITNHFKAHGNNIHITARY